MAFGAIEIPTIARAQDYTVIKHNEDSKGLVDQTNIGQQIQKQINERTKQVNEGDNTQWQNRKFDAKEKGDNEYNGNGGKKRRTPKVEQVVARKEHQGFDIKI